MIGNSPKMHKKAAHHAIHRLLGMRLIQPSERNLFGFLLVCGDTIQQDDAIGVDVQADSWPALYNRPRGGVRERKSDQIIRATG
jgi:hypothetical protein